MRYNKIDMVTEIAISIIVLLMILLLTYDISASETIIDINTDNIDSGYISIKFVKDTDKKVKLLIRYDDTRYTYNISNMDEYTNFPLQLGNGKYTIGIYENTVDSKYRRLASETIELDLEDYKVVFLNSVQEIDYATSNDMITLARRLLVQLEVDRRMEELDDDIILTQYQIIKLYYDSVVETIRYDYDKIKTIKYNYLPSNDVTLDTSTGICYDYSSLLASMLRSQGIPTKLVKGYANYSKVYHAWNEIYLEKEDRWITVDTTYDSYLFLKEARYNFEKDNEVYNKIKEY